MKVTLLITVFALAVSGCSTVSKAHNGAKVGGQIGSKTGAVVGAVAGGVVGAVTGAILPKMGSDDEQQGAVLMYTPMPTAVHVPVVATCDDPWVCRIERELAAAGYDVGYAVQPRAQSRHAQQYYSTRQGGLSLLSPAK